MKNGKNKFAKFADKALTTQQAENVTGGKVLQPADELAGVDEKCLCTLSNGNQISGGVCLDTKVGGEVQPGVTVTSKAGC